MDSNKDEKLIIKHLIDGTLGDNLCIICLAPLNELYENIFTKICKDDKEYCVADVLRTICNIEIKNENYNVCIECFIASSLAYKFYLLTTRSHKLLNFYTDQLLNNIEIISNPLEEAVNNICIYLPKIDLNIFDNNLKGVNFKEIKKEEKIVKSKQNDRNIKSKDDDVIIIVEENGESIFYKMLDNGELILIKDCQKQSYKETLSQSITVLGKKIKSRKKRVPMSYKKCSRCPVKYRFIAKLQNHMKNEHNIDLYVCKICKASYENALQYHNHMKTHTNVHQCDICDTIFKKRNTIISHLKWHQKMDNLGQSDSAHICEICGLILESEANLSQHWDKRHHKKYTCYYCGRLYKGESSFNMHINKHEQQRNGAKKKPDENDTPKPVVEKPRCTCAICGKNFVDQRSLLWHERLHSNERPYKCDVCGRGFITVNRRNQHAVCAHTAPSRRCPICPALFHLRSMVNSHIKKVHLKTHKRRNRTSKYQDVFWRTEPVPIQELSVSIQNELLELQAGKENDETEHWTRSPVEQAAEI